MKTRIDALCELVALKTTTPAQISERLLEEKIEIINNTHVTHHSLPVEWAAQTGSFENVRFLIEELHVHLDSNVEPANLNILQWSHDKRADPEVKVYLTDLDKKLWRKFHDGTDDLHIYAYKGMTAEVEAILSQTPDRICELVRDRYSPLYWAYLGEQNEMQTLLLSKLSEYKQRHADNDEKMLTFHVGMLFATTQHVESYAHFDAFMTLGKRMSAADFRVRINFEGMLHRYMFHAEHRLAKIFDFLKKTNDLNILQDCNDITKQAIQINLAISKRTEIDDAKLSALVLVGMKHHELSSSRNQEMLNAEMAKPEQDWSFIEECLNASYNDAEEGILLTDSLLSGEENIEAKNQRKIAIGKLKLNQSLAELSEKRIREENQTIKIKRQPIKELFMALQNKENSTKEIVDFINDHSIDVAEFYRYRAAIDHAVLHGSLQVATDLMTIYREALAIPEGSKRKNLMQLVRGRNEVSQEMKNYILNPEYRLWELFQDGTTDLHAHAYAGRVEEVLNLLIETPDRYLEVNRDGENVFYWAFSSEAQASFLEKMDAADVYKLMLAAAERWDDLIKYFQHSQKFLKECIKPRARIELVKSHLEWLEELEGHENASGYLMVNDCLRIMLAQAYIENKDESEVQYQANLFLAKDALKGVVNQDSCAEVQFELVRAFVTSSAARATKYRDNGDDQSAKFKFSNAKQSFTDALVAQELASKSLEDWPNDLFGKAVLTLQIKNFLEEVNIKLVSLDEFLFLDNAIDIREKVDTSTSTLGAALSVEANLLWSDTYTNTAYSSLLSHSIFNLSPEPIDDEALEKQEDEEEKKVAETKPEPQSQSQSQSNHQSRPTM